MASFISMLYSEEDFVLGSALGTRLLFIPAAGWLHRVFSIPLFYFNARLLERREYWRGGINFTTSF